MAKKLLSTLLLCTLPFAFTSIFAASEAVAPKNATLKADECDAPPPDSFRVTGIGSSGVDLAWIPAWFGATQTLVLFREDASGGWINLATYYDVPGSSFTVTVLTPGSYKMTNATNCPNGGASSKNSEVRWKNIELTTAGRTPVNPQPITCNQIDFLNHEWVGFSVQEKISGVANLFEFQPYGATVLIKRVVHNHPIVAVDQDGNFPIGPEHLQVASIFRMEDKSKPAEDRVIGFVKFSTDAWAPEDTIGLCIHLDTLVQWKPSYKFTALFAESVLTSPNIGGGGIGLIRPHIFETLTAQNPFTNNLTIFIPETFSETNEATLHLMDLNGHIVLNHKFDMSSAQVSFLTDTLQPGLYLLKIESEIEIQTIKVVKL